ncbi:MAG: hypothetical protein AB7I50_19395 [Vicinamibacterales bacterium]
MKRAAAAVAVVAIALAYLAGFWPQRRQLTEAREQLQTLQERLTAAESRLRLAALLGQLLRLSDAVAVKNYGDAATLSSGFFDAVRTEVSRTDHAEVRATLQQILDSRDRVTTAIAATEPTLGTVLEAHERTLRQTLGYPVSASS